MKKIMLSLIAIICMSVGIVYAHPHYVSSSVNENLFGGFNIGAVAPQDHSFDFANHGFQSYRFEAGVTVGKMMTPYFGISLTDEALVNTTKAKTAFDENRLLFDTHFNLTPLFTKNDNPKWEVEVVPSFGWLHLFGVSKHQANYATCRGAVSVNYNVNDNVSVTLSPGINYTDRFRNYTGGFDLRLGVNYRIGKFKKCYNTRTEDEYTAVVNELVNANRSISALSEALKSCEESKNIVVTNDTVTECNCAEDVLPYIYFEKNQFDINNPQMLNTLSDIIDYLNENKDATVTVHGYADKNTGTAELNKVLSDSRAQKVSDMLKASGIDVSRIHVVGHGDTEQPFETNDKNRVVIVSLD